eukprot:TRINITY_DN2070_c0_g2_i2.p1 TRINITY_DN2070_c0_g2~~TRINITY_DN2070_c0_g2_i2.p1  ORF type:complete len:226 (+),score=75.49 TRINITY_DN2070_c0_g2_i2:58-678(+)
MCVFSPCISAKYLNVAKCCANTNGRPYQFSDPNCKEGFSALNNRCYSNCPAPTQYYWANPVLCYRPCSTAAGYLACTDEKDAICKTTCKGAYTQVLTDPVTQLDMAKKSIDAYKAGNKDVAYKLAVSVSQNMNYQFYKKSKWDIVTKIGLVANKTLNSADWSQFLADLNVKWNEVDTKVKYDPSNKIDADLQLFMQNLVAVPICQV